jgi:hypothetical protein
MHMQAPDDHVACTFAIASARASRALHWLRTPFEMHQAKMESVDVCAGVVISVDEFKRDFGQLGARDAIEHVNEKTDTPIWLELAAADALDLGS